MSWQVPAGVALALVALAWAAGSGRIRLDRLPDPVHTTPALGVRQGIAPSPLDLASVRFETALRGYDPRSVDLFLAQWARRLEGGSPEEPAEVDPILEDVTFPVVLRGYRMDQVDEALEALSVRG